MITVYDKPSTGFLWSCSITDGADVIEAASKTKSKSSIFGGSGGNERQTRITLKALKPDGAVIDMQLIRGYAILETKRYAIQVAAAP